MEHWEPGAAIVTQARQTVLDSLLADLDLGLTFLDVAETTKDPRHARQNIKHALEALRTANRFLAKLGAGTFDVEAVRQRREQLAQRLRAVTGLSP